MPEPQSPPSDNDTAERPVREQLKETSIKSVPETAQESTSSRKRSLEESREEPADDNGAKPRKRSRNSTPEQSTVSDPSVKPILATTPKGFIYKSKRVIYKSKGVIYKSKGAIYKNHPTPEHARRLCLKLVEGQDSHAIKAIAKSLAKIAQKKRREEKELRRKKADEKEKARIQKEECSAWRRLVGMLQKRDLTIENLQDAQRKNDPADTKDTENPAITTATTKEATGTDSTDTNLTTDGEREKKRPRDNSQEPKPITNNVCAPVPFSS